ncbi:MAG: ABC transporter substrate-binding protein [Thermoplasmata archaeon]
MIPYITVGSANLSVKSEGWTWDDKDIGNFNFNPRDTWTSPAQVGEAVIFYDFTNVTWHDGTQMTVRDIMFSMHMAGQVPEWSSSMNPLKDMGGYAGSNYTTTSWLHVYKVWESPDQLQAALKFELQIPYAEFFRDTLNTFLLPYHIWGSTVSGQNVDDAKIWCDPGYNLWASDSWKVNAAQSYDNIPPIASGLFKFDYWNAGSSSRVLTYRGHFFDENYKYTDYVLDQYGQSLAKQPNIDSITFKIYKTADAAVLALKNGDVDYIAWNVPPSYIPELTKEPNIGMAQILESGFFYMGYNMRLSSFGYKEGDPLMGDIGKPFRKAVAHCINKERIVTHLLMNHGVAGDGPVAPSSEWYNNSIPRYAFDPYEAKVILANAGYKVNANGTFLVGQAAIDAAGLGNWWVNPDGTPIGSSVGGKIEILTPEANYDPIRAQAGLMIAEQLRNVGIYAESVAMDFDTIVNRIDNRDFDMYILGWTIGSEPTDYLWAFFHSSNAVIGQNYPGYQNASFDMLIDQARASQDYDEKKELIFEAQAAICYDLPCDVLYYRTNSEVYRSDRFVGWVSGKVSIFNDQSLKLIHHPDLELPSPSPEEKDSGGTLRVALKGEPGPINPLTSVDENSQAVIDLVFDSLARIDPQSSEVIPWVADNWQIYPDRVRVSLRNDVRWHDGRLLNANDVKYTYDTYSLPYIASIFVLDMWTLDFNLSYPGPKFFSEAILMKLVPEGFNVTSEGNGCGPFILGERIPGASLDLVANPAYFAGQPNIDGIRFSYYSDAMNASIDLINGTIDFIGWALTLEESFQMLDVNGTLTSLLLHGDTIATNNNGLNQMQLGFNTQHTPLDIVEFRRVIALAVNKEGLTVYDISGGLKAAHSLTNPFNIPYYNISIGKSRSDIMRANQMLDAAGFFDRDSDGWRNLPTSPYDPFQLTLLGPPISDVVGYTMSTNIITWLQQIGLNVTLVSLNDTARQTAIESGNFDIYFDDMETERDPAFLNTLAGTGFPGNYANYSDATMDYLLSRMNTEIDPVLRAEYAKDCFGWLAQEIPYLPLFDMKSYNAYNKNGFTGWVPMLGGIANFWSYLNVYPVYDPTPIDAPQALFAFRPDNSSIRLTWAPNDEPGLTGYNIYRSEVSGGPYSLIDTVGPITSFQDGSIESNKEYYYVISGMEPESGYSNEANVHIVNQTPYPTPWFDGFEDGWGDWTTEIINPSSTAPTEWEIGNPMGTGPGSAYNGTQCAGTNIDDYYHPYYPDIALLSPYMQLNSGPLILTFNTWYNSHYGCWARDGGFVEINDGSGWAQIYPEGSYPDYGSMGGYNTYGFSGQSDGWEFYEFDISAYSGQVVQIRFHFAALSCRNTYWGWYVDDVFIGSPPDYRVSLTPEAQTGSGNLGETVIYNLTVENTGLLDDVYDLSVSGNSWDTRLYNANGTAEISNIYLIGGESADIQVRVSVPFDVVAGDLSMATITAASRSAAINGTATITTRVNSVKNLNTGIWYSTIQEAVNAAVTGHQLWARNGTYNEHVTINKRLTLIGEDRDTTIIDGGGTGVVVRITASYVNIRGFTIRNGGTYNWDYSGIYLSWGLNNCRIEDNTITANQQGIWVSDSCSNNVIVNNAIISNNEYGIILYYYCHNNTISNNIISSNDMGIRFYGERCNSNTITQNNILNNHYGIYIYSWGSPHQLNQITYNNILSNGYIGVYMEWNAQYNFIHHNNIADHWDRNAYDYQGLNYWDDGYPSGGNYWGDYSGNDFYSGPNQDIPGFDGFGDTPYTNMQGNPPAQDRYPFMKSIPGCGPQPVNDTEPPQHANEFPAPGAIISNPTPTISVWLFDNSWLNESTIKLYVNGYSVKTQKGLKSDGQNVYFNVSYTHTAGFVDGETMNCRITARDIHGNYMEYTWQFTVDLVAPYVVSVSPTNGAWDVPMNTTVSVTFSEPMGHASAEAAFSINPTVSGYFTWDGNTMNFHPNTNLAPTTEYFLSVNGDAKDVAGNNLAYYSWSFITEQAGIRIFHAPAPTVELGTSLIVECDVEAFWGSYVTSCTLYYMPVGGSTYLPISMSLQFGDEYYGTWVGMIPAQNLVGTLRYYILAQNNFSETATYPETDPTTSPVPVSVIDTAAPGHSNEQPMEGSVMPDDVFIVSVDITDISAINTGSIEFFIDGFSVDYTLSLIPNGYRVSYLQESGFTNKSVICRIIADDVWGNHLDWSWSFLIARPVMVMTKEAPLTANPGQIITYWVNFTNIGNDWAYDVVLTEFYPAGVTFISSIPFPTMDNVWWIGNVAPGATMSIQIAVMVGFMVPSGTVLNNTVSLQYNHSIGISYLEEESAFTTVIAPAMVVEKTAPSTAQTDETITYTITYQNTGSDTAYNIWISDTLPAGVIFISATPLPSTLIGQTLSWYIGSIPPGGSGVIFVNVTVSAFSGTLINMVALDYMDFQGTSYPTEYDSASTDVVDLPPDHSNECPPINGITTDTTPNISVHVTDNSGVNATTIRLYINGFSVAVDLTPISGGFNVSYWHESGFAYGQVVSCRIYAKDFSGNILDFTWQFTIFTPPWIINTAPGDGIVDVDINSDIVVTFNKPMNTSSVTYFCTPDPGGWSVEWSVGNTVATYTHNAFDYGVNYNFTITGGTDMDDNVIIAGATSNPWTFTTLLYPATATITGPSGVSNIGIQTITYIWDGAPTSVNLYYTTQTSSPYTWVLIGNENPVDGIRTWSLPAPGTYGLKASAVGSGSIENSPPLSNEEPESWFTYDTTPPSPPTALTVEHWGPVPPTDHNTLNWTASASGDVSHYNIYRADNDGGPWTDFIASVQAGTNTYVDLGKGQADEIIWWYVVRAMDVAGNVETNTNAVSEPLINPPIIIFTVPVNGELNVSYDQDIIVTFNKPMNTGSVTFSCNPDPGGWTVSWNANNTVATFSHNYFNDCFAEHTFEITGGTDIDGNALIAGTVPNPWSWTLALYFQRYGVTDAGPGVTITAWIDGVEYGRTVTGPAGDFTIRIYADMEPDGVKTGGHIADTIRYAVGDLTGHSAWFFAETDTFIVGGMINGVLTSQAWVPLLKISAVATQSIWSEATDWIRIYNPTAAAVDVTAYSIGIGTGGPVVITSGQIIYGMNPLPAGAELYISLANWGGLSNTGSAIRLFYGANIVDRVEYGVIATEPENTYMPNAAAPPVCFEIYRLPHQWSDSNDCMVDFCSRVEVIPLLPIAYDIPIPGPTGPRNDWVFVSFPIEISGSIWEILDDSVYGGGGTAWDVAKGWDNVNKKWLTYRSGYASTLTIINNQMGVWLHLTNSDGNLTTGVTGDYPGSTVQIQLYAGWNLVGFPSATSVRANTILNADIVGLYLGTSPYVQDRIDLNNVWLSEGNAYWVHVTANTLWTVTNSAPPQNDPCSDQAEPSGTKGGGSSLVPELASQPALPQSYDLDATTPLDSRAPEYGGAASGLLPMLALAMLLAAVWMLVRRRRK